MIEILIGFLSWIITFLVCLGALAVILNMLLNTILDGDDDVD